MLVQRLTMGKCPYFVNMDTENREESSASWRCCSLVRGREVGTEQLSNQLIDRSSLCGENLILFLKSVKENVKMSVDIWSFQSLYFKHILFLDILFYADFIFCTNPVMWDLIKCLLFEPLFHYLAPGSCINLERYLWCFCPHKWHCGWFQKES